MAVVPASDCALLQDTCSAVITPSAFGIESLSGQLLNQRMQLFRAERQAIATPGFTPVGLVSRFPRPRRQGSGKPTGPCYWQRTGGWKRRSVRFTPRPCLPATRDAGELANRITRGTYFSGVPPGWLDKQVMVESPLRWASVKTGGDVTLYSRGHYCYYVLRPVDIIPACRGVGLFSGRFGNSPADS